jgi:hypothetical protein
MRIRHRFLVATIFAVSLSTSLVATALAANEGQFWTGTSQTGSNLPMDWGTTKSNLANDGFNNVISSMTSSNPTSHGFVLWTDANGQGSSFKVCGPTTRNTMPTGFDNTVSSIYSTSICPQ